MIFVTVGTELPFNRMVRAVDQWARETRQTEIFAQIGHSDWAPSFIPYRRFLEPPEFARNFAAASLIIAHAGMGTILSALHFGKPILVMPRRAALGEQRNDHQLATAHRLLELKKIQVAFDETALIETLSKMDELRPREIIGPYACNSLIAAIDGFIRNAPAGQNEPGQKRA